jgi:tetratricopeptide (TPR) repeat protein
MTINPANANFEALSDDQALDHVGTLVDRALDNNDESIACAAISLCNRLDERQLGGLLKVLLDYYRSNAWAAICNIRREHRDAVWAWDQPEIRQQIFFLRRALNSDSFAQVDFIPRCSILTNLGNQLNTLGRFVEARQYWNEALRIEPRFWMARANRASALMYYANALYDDEDFRIFALHAHRDVTWALNDMEMWPELGDISVRAAFSDVAKQIKQKFDLSRIEKDLKPSIRKAKKSAQKRGDDELAYRKWCLENGLFLNPLSDVEMGHISSQDVLSLPSFNIGLNGSLGLVGFFNQLKQEYVSARWTYYESQYSLGGETHFSDKDVLLHDTMDYPVYGLSLEKTKLAFRVGYSVLDKIAYFLNAYMSLGIVDNQVYFRTVWHVKTKKGKAGAVRTEFTASENWPFRGLYWLSMDLFDEEMAGVLEPDAYALHQLRNQLEHKYVKVHEFRPASGRTSHDLYHDHLAHAIGQAELRHKTLRTLKLARAALIYLSLGMHREEQRRSKLGGPGKITLPVFSTPFSDERKV